MDQEWELLQLAQRAFSAGDLSGALRFADEARTGFQSSPKRSAPEVPTWDPQGRRSYRDRIEERLSNDRRHEEDLPVPLDERETGIQAAMRLIEAVKRSISPDQPLGPGAATSQAAVLGHLRQDGTAEISVYLPSLEAADDFYFDRLYQRFMEGVQHKASPRVYVDQVSAEADTNRVERIGVTIVAESSICRLFVTRVPHFQVTGEMIAPLDVARDACGEYIELLNTWLNYKAVG